MEHRGIWTGLAVTLIAIGVGAFLTYVVTLKTAAPPRGIEWFGVPSLASWTCVLAGAVLIGLILRSLRGQRSMRIRLANLLGEGVELLGNVRAESDQSRMGVWENRADEWGDRAYKTLCEDVPEYSSLFWVDANSGTQFRVAGRERQSNIGNWLERRTGRLAEIVLKV